MSDERTEHAVNAAITATQERYAANHMLTDVDLRTIVEVADKTFKEHDAREWHHLNSALAQRLSFAVEAENYPAGYEEASKIATVLWRSGMLYAINTAVLHPLGLALGVNVSDPDEHGVQTVTSLFLAGTDDPEGIAFDAQSHEEGLAKIHDVALPILVSSLEAAHRRLGSELDRRQLATSGQTELDDAPNGA